MNSVHKQQIILTAVLFFSTGIAFGLHMKVELLKKKEQESNMESAALPMPKEPITRSIRK